MSLGVPKLDGPRRTEQEINKTLNDIRPGLLGVLYDAVATALKTQSTTEGYESIRMTDAARWISAGEASLGFESGQLVASIIEGQTNLLVDVIANDPLYLKLMFIVADAPFTGMIAELFTAIELSSDRDKNLPKTPAHLSNALKRIAPAVIAVGLNIELLGRNKKGREVRIYRNDQNPEQGGNKWKPSF